MTPQPATHPVLSIRWMIRPDLPAVLAISDESFHTPWTQAEFLSVLRKRNVIGLVAEDKQGIVGYAIYQVCKSHTTILNLAVHPWFRRQTCGSQLIRLVVRRARDTRRELVGTVICEDNLPGQLFLKAKGFRATEIENGVYPGGLDGYVFERDLSRLECS